MPLDLFWLRAIPDWKSLLDQARRQPLDDAFATFQKLADSRMDFVRAGHLDKAVQQFRAEHGDPAQWPLVRIALLGSSTLSHLAPAIRVAALRRGLLVDVYVGPYGQYRQELADPASGLRTFAPEIVCFCLDAQHVVGADLATADAAVEDMRACWAAARRTLRCSVIQQTLLPRIAPVMGNNEQRLPQSAAALALEVNALLRARAVTEDVALLSVDLWAAQTGVESWFDAGLWYSAKQEIHPRASMLFGDQAARLIAAMKGRSAKCLVLDLDNTLWGGVIGDDGLQGILLGQGTALGEAFHAFQRYVQQLAHRGVILAVCSKNDYENAVLPFNAHPETVLRQGDFACFVANWQDKATNIRQIAATLNIGLESLVLVDDNPAERALIRAELPMVSVPELPEDPAEYIGCLAAAGYFEGLHVTAEDRERTSFYRANASREELRQVTTDLDGYLRSLEMRLTYNYFDEIGLARVVQLINKTNQFNLTTHRYSEAEVSARMMQKTTLTLQLRLADVHGDNGMIAVLIGDRGEDGTLCIDTWLMSCRVLGRGVEEATLNVLCAEAKTMGVREIVGVYKPTAKNGMVKNHYSRLGFELDEVAADGSTRWRLPLEQFTDRQTHVRNAQGEAWKNELSTKS